MSSVLFDQSHGSKKQSRHYSSISSKLKLFNAALLIKNNLFNSIKVKNLASVANLVRKNKQKDVLNVAKKFEQLFVIGCKRKRKKNEKKFYIEKFCGFFSRIFSGVLQIAFNNVQSRFFKQTSCKFLLLPT